MQPCRRQSHSLTARSAASCGPCPAPRRGQNARRVRKAPIVRPPSQPPTSATTISLATRLVLTRLGGSPRRQAPRCRPALRQVSPLPFSLPNLRGGGGTPNFARVQEGTGAVEGSGSCLKQHERHVLATCDRVQCPRTSERREGSNNGRDEIRPGRQLTRENDRLCRQLLPAASVGSPARQRGERTRSSPRHNRRSVRLEQFFVDDRTLPRTYCFA